jgi:hypothetical protein
MAGRGDPLSLVRPEPAAVEPPSPQLLEAYEREQAAYAEEVSPYDAAPVLDNKVRIALHRRQLRQIDDLLAARREYAGKIHRMALGWLVGVGVVLLLAGWSAWTHFVLGEKVLLALIGGTTVNVLGIFAIVANFLFPKGPGDPLVELIRRTDADGVALAPPPAARPAARRGGDDPGAGAPG